MKIPRLTSLLVLAAAALSHAGDSAPANPRIDFPGFLKDAQAVQQAREQRRVTEGEFLKMAREPGTVILDARSSDKFAMLHVEGAVNLPLPDFGAASLAQVIPGKSTRILIYCNNNFIGDEVAMLSKVERASLNIYTFTSLHSYGYDNVYELAPLRRIQDSKLPLAGSRVSALRESEGLAGNQLSSGAGFPRPVLSVKPGSR